MQQPPGPERTLSKIDTIVVALADAGGHTRALDTEDVAVAAHRLAPTTFCWRKYPDQIDLDMVRTTLRHAGERHDPRVTGSVRTGWNLTSEGADWVRAHGDALRAAIGTSAPANSSAVRKENLASRREVERLRISPAFARFQADGELTATDAGWVFRIDLYTAVRERSMKIERMRAAASEALDLEPFLAAAAALVEQIPRPHLPVRGER